MPRKTEQQELNTRDGGSASMRPRPDAAENGRSGMFTLGSNALQ